jgi:hypothetical protein
MSRRAELTLGIALGVLLGVAIVVGFVFLGSEDTVDAPSIKNGSGAPAPAPAPMTIVLRNAKPVGGVQRLEYKQGQRVRFSVSSDVADEIHVHGYDHMKDVAASGSVSFDFPAKLEGVFEVELEGRQEQIAELRVLP